MGEDFGTDVVFSMEDYNKSKLTLFQEQSESAECQSCFFEIENSDTGDTTTFGLSMKKIDTIISELQKHKKWLKKVGYDKSSETLSE